MLGRRAANAIARTGGRWRQQRQRAMAAGERMYRRWGRVAVFVTPTWVSGAMRMPRNAFLVWNALAAIVSTCIAVLGAYGIGAAVLGQLAKKRGVIALVLAVLALAAVIIALVRHRAPDEGPQEPPRWRGSKGGKGRSGTGRESSRRSRI